MASQNQFDPADDYRRVLARTLMMQGADTSPVKHWTQGAARLAQALVGSMWGNQLQQEQMAAMQYNPLAAPGGSADASPASAPPMGNKIAEALSQPQDASLPRGIRNNNPLNIEAGNFTQSQPGFAGSDGRFAKFQSPDQGVAAADSLLQTYAQKHGLNTVGGIVNRWAPPSDNNPTSSYAATVAKQIGVDPNAPLNMSDPAIRQKIIAAMGQFENGRPIQMASANPAGITPDTQPATQQSMQVAQAQPTTDMLNQMERNVDRTLQDPNVPFEVKRKAYGYKQFIIQKRMEQSLKYGPEAIAGEASKAGAIERAKQGAQFSPEGIAGAARLEGAKEEAALPAKAVLKGSPTFEDKQKLEQKDRALGTLSDTVSGIAKNYVALDRMGAIPNSDKGAMANLSARAQSSAAGQEAGQAIGAKSASIRQEILNSRPQLINAIRQATQMGARGLDSNVELSFYMQQTSDPTRDVWSNLAALDKLDKAYGLGGSLKKVLTPEQYARVEKGSAALAHEFKASQGGSDPLGIR